MEIDKLTKQQIILTCTLVAFVSAIATGITVVTLMSQSTQTIATPINRIIRQTIESTQPSEVINQPALSADETKLLNQLKTVGSFVATISVRDENKKDTAVGSGLFFGDNKIIVTGKLPELKEKQSYIATSIFGEQSIVKVTTEKEYTIIELKKKEEVVVPPVVPETPPGGEQTPAPSQ